MNPSSLARSAVAAALLSLVASAAVAETSFTSLTIFGDSLSDTGNISLITGGTQPPAGQPYADGAFSDGPLWTDLLAADLGFPAAAVPSLTGGTNYAWAAARITGGVVPSITTQINSPGLGFWGNVAADPTGLYVLAAGSNDMRDARSSFPTSGAADQAGRQTAAEAAIADLKAALGQMADKGVKNVLLANQPDLGTSPEAAGLGLVAASADASARFNALMNDVVSYGEGRGLTISVLDMGHLSDAIYDDALTNNGGIYGITNVLFPCAGFVGSDGSPCSVSAFSDALHPSSRVHQIFADAAVASLSHLTVPLPSALWLLLSALPLLSKRSRSGAR